MTDPAFHVHRGVEEMASAVAVEIARAALSAVRSRGQALLAFPGGSTPWPVFRKLASADLPWPKVTIFPGDDRLVATDSELSSFGVISRDLGPSGALIVPIAADALDYRAAGDLADERLRQLAWPPDLVWLGMGEDGHTASLFPGPDLDRAMEAPEHRRAIGVRPEPMPAEAPVDRVTLTLSSILSGRTMIITMRGKTKRDLFEAAMNDGDASRLPIGRVLAKARNTPSVHWCP